MSNNHWIFILFIQLYERLKTLCTKIHFFLLYYSSSFWVIQLFFSTSNDENNRERKLTMIVNCMIISIVMTNSTHNYILMRHSDTNNVSKFFYIMHKFFVTQQLRVSKFNLNMNIKIINFICSTNIKYNNSIKWKHFLFNEKIIFFSLTSCNSKMYTRDFAHHIFDRR
jgi:hypothetical protein